VNAEDIPPGDGPPPLRADSRTPEGVRHLARELVPVFYDQLKRVAQRARSRLGAGHTMQTTALVHEAYLRLKDVPGFTDDAHFMRAAALAMRHALINYAEARVAGKRGGGRVHVTLSHAEEVSTDTDEGLLAVHEALERLAAEFPRLADVVECRFFGGFGEEDTARALGISLRTAQRDWLKARAWLFRELRGRP